MLGHQFPEGEKNYFIISVQNSALYSNGAFLSCLDLFCFHLNVSLIGFHLFSVPSFSVLRIYCTFYTVLSDALVLLSVRYVIFFPVLFKQRTFVFFFSLCLFVFFRAKVQRTDHSTINEAACLPPHHLATVGKYVGPAPGQDRLLLIYVI